MTLNYTISISNAIGWSSHDIIPGHHCNVSYEVARQVMYNITVTATNDVGDSNGTSINDSMCVCVCVCVCVSVCV